MEHYPPKHQNPTHSSRKNTIENFQKSKGLYSMKAKLSIVMIMRLTEKSIQKMLEEDEFLEYLKNLNFGVRKSGKTYHMRLTKTVKNEEQALKIKEALRGYGTIHKTTSRNQKQDKEYVYYQYNISHKEVKEIFNDPSNELGESYYLDEYFREYKNYEEITNTIYGWIVYTDDKTTVSWQRQQGREDCYYKLKELLEDEKKPKVEKSAEELANEENEKMKRKWKEMEDRDIFEGL